METAQASVTGQYHEDDEAELGELHNLDFDGLEYDETDDDDDGVVIGDPAELAGGINVAKIPKLKSTISRFTTIGCSQTTAPPLVDTRLAARCRLGRGRRELPGDPEGPLRPQDLDGCRGARAAERVVGVTPR